MEKLRKYPVNLVKEESEIMQLILDDAKIGWWIADYENRFYQISGNLQEVLGLPRNIVPFAVFREMIRKDFRINVIKGIETIDVHKHYDQIFR